MFVGELRGLNQIMRTTYRNKNLLLIMLLIACLPAHARDYSTYPCNVFSSRFCFRTTSEVGVEMSVPADYTIYKLIHRKEAFATFYVGNHPEEVAGGELKKFKSGSLSASFSKKTQSGGGEMVWGFDFLFYGMDDMPFAHLKISSNHAHKKALFSLVSSIRPCAPLKQGGQICEVNKEWSTYMVDFMQKSIGGL